MRIRADSWFPSENLRLTISDSMPKTDYIELGNRERLTILYEDRTVLAIDKPPGWMLVPVNWQSTSRNLQAALLSSIAAGAFWARCRNLLFLRYVHRLDAETSGVLLFAKSRGALDSIGDLFEARQVSKTYLAVVRGRPAQNQWTCQLPLSPDPQAHGRVIVDRREGKAAETHFRVVGTRAEARGGETTLIEARPVTGRMHQIRLHLKSDGLPILGDVLYGAGRSDRMPDGFPLALRAATLAYRDPFGGRPVRIEAPRESFLRAFGFAGDLSARSRQP